MTDTSKSKLRFVSKTQFAIRTLVRVAMTVFGVIFTFLLRAAHDTTEAPAEELLRPQL